MALRHCCRTSVTLTALSFFFSRRRLCGIAATHLSHSLSLPQHTNFDSAALLPYICHHGPPYAVRLCSAHSSIPTLTLRHCCRISVITSASNFIPVASVPIFIAQTLLVAIAISFFNFASFISYIRRTTFNTFARTILNYFLTSFPPLPRLNMPPKNPRNIKKSTPTSKLRSNPSLRLPSIPSYMVIDSSLPVHVFSDRTVFQTYIPGHKTHTTPYGNTLVIEGTGTVVVRVAAEGTFFNFTMDDCWHVPASPNHFYSCLRANSKGIQAMVSSRSPRLLTAHQQRLLQPKLPKYFPLTKKKGPDLLVLAFSRTDPPPRPLPLPPSTKTSDPFSISLLNSTIPSVAFAASTYSPPPDNTNPANPFKQSNSSPSYSPLFPTPLSQDIPIPHLPPSPLNSPSYVSLLNQQQFPPENSSFSSFTFISDYDSHLPLPPLSSDISPFKPPDPLVSSPFFLNPWL